MSFKRAGWFPSLREVIARILRSVEESVKLMSRSMELWERGGVDCQIQALTNIRTNQFGFWLGWSTMELMEQRGLYLWFIDLKKPYDLLPGSKLLD